MPDLWDNPMGTDGFEFVEYAAPDPRALGPCSRAWASRPSRKHRHKDVMLYRQGDDQFHRQRRAGASRRLRAPARPERLRHGVSREGRARPPTSGARARRLGPSRPRRADGAGHAGDQGHRRRADLPGRPLSGERLRPHDLRRRLRPLPGYEAFWAGKAPPPGGSGLTYIDHLTHNVYRGRMKEWAEFYETPVQLPRDPLLRHRGQADRAEVQGDDQPLRQDPHPDQRDAPTTARRSRSTSTNTAARASSTSRSARATSTPPSTR